jgi:hypothetical protein
VGIDPWSGILFRLPDGNAAFRFDEICTWDPERLAFLLSAGILRQGPLARYFACDSCPAQHVEEVYWEESALDPSGRRAYIPCPEDIPINIPIARLQQWVPDAGTLAEHLAGAMELIGRVSELASGNLWKLGRRRLAGRFRDVFLAVVPQDKVAAISEVAIENLGAPDGILLVPAVRGSTSRGMGERLVLIQLSETSELTRSGVVLDVDYIEDALPQDRTLMKEDKIRSLPVPDGTKWDEILLETDDRRLRVCVGGRHWDLALEDVGFADARKKLGEVDKAFHVLQWFAARRGILPLGEIEKQYSERRSFQKQVSLLRSRLRKLIPVQEDPFVWQADEEDYRCRFKIRPHGVIDLPRPASGSWADCQVADIGDGRVAFGVKANQRIRAFGERRDSSRAFPEAAEQETVVWQEFSLVELGLAKDVDALEPEGRMLLELIRSNGKLSRPKNGGSFDLVALRLAKWLREHSSIDDEPIRYTEAMNTWMATFECASKRQT